MHLMYTLDTKGNRVYTLKVALFCITAIWPSAGSHTNGHSDIAHIQKLTSEGKVSKSAHPARFSPDDKFSRHRVTIKKRFGILPTQLPSKPL